MGKHDRFVDFGPSLHGLSRSDWIAEVEELVHYDGHLTRLGARHWSAFTEHGSTLLVSFETLQGIEVLSPTAQPLGWDMVTSRGWSSLTLMSDGDTWFRDPDVYAYFDQLVDEGFFDRFDTVLFYGSGSCGYAAAAYSVTSPGAVVLAIHPQATLARPLTEWDRRFPDQLRQDFSSRYGYAPDMLDGAQRAHIVYDPFQIEDAMHAQLFRLPCVLHHRLPHMGGSLQADLMQMDILQSLMMLVARDALSPARFARLARARRDHMPYLRRLLARTEEEDRPDLTRLLCQNVTDRLHAPRFAQRLHDLTHEEA